MNTAIMEVCATLILISATVLVILLAVQFAVFVYSEVRKMLK